MNITKKILIINSVYGIRSTGRIVKDLHDATNQVGWESYVIYGRIQQPYEKNVHYIGNKTQVVYEMAKTAVFGHHGLGSELWTNRIIEHINEINPDIIHLHNIHGYYVNVASLFKYLKTLDVPIVWTLHDCWAYTGHCAYYTYVACDKWKTGCHHCPALKTYPYSILSDRSKKNYLEKREFFTGLNSCTLVTPSKWLSKEVKTSYLKDYPVEVIPNGIDLEVFKPQEHRSSTRFTILAVANIWEERKGLKYCLELAEYLSEDEQLVIIGLNDVQVKGLPKHVIGIKRTESVQELVDWYNRADVYINPTLEDNFPTTNLEALACGTPIITFDTGGSIESVTESTGFVVESNSLALYEAVLKIKEKGKAEFTLACRKVALEHFGRDKMKRAYIDLYKRMIENA